MTQPVLECTSPWETTCLCGDRYVPCWPRPDTSCCDRLEPVDPTPEQTARIERMLHVATEIIWRLSGKQFGGCPVTVRPCRQTCTDRETFGYWSGNTWTPVLSNGSWFNQKCGKCGPTGCGCTELCEIDLPGPVAEIIQVKQDGVVLDPSAYRLDNASKLVRQPTLEPVAFSTSMFSSAQVGPFVPGNDWCSLTPVPDVIIGAGALVGSCYPSTVVNPAFTWNSAQTIEATWSATAPNDTIVSFFDGSPGGDDFVFPAHPLPFTPGEVLESASNAAGHRLRVTMVSGSMTRYFNTTHGFVLTPGTVIRMERVAFTVACWPTCQELGLPDTELGTLSVTMRPGTAVPQGGLWAAGLLACQLLAACDEGGECALPANAQRIARQGVTVELTPILIDRENGGFNTGIPSVDLWLESVNPFAIKSQSRVYSPDRPQVRVTTWPCEL